MFAAMSTLFAVLPENFLSAFLAELIGALIMGVLAVILFVGGFKLFDKVTPGIDFEKSIDSNPIATAVVMASFFISIAIVMATVFQGR